MADPQTIVRDGSGAQTASYQLPPGLFQYVESVLVEVDNTAGGDARPTLKVATVNGQVMATKRQAEAIPAGDTGTASWALRLADDAAGSGLDLQQAVYFAAPQNVPAAGGDLSWAFSSGDDLLDLAVPSAPAVRTAGLYAVNVLSNFNDATVAGKFYSANLLADGTVFPAQLHNVSPMSSNSSIGDTGTTACLTMDAGNNVSLHIFHESGVNQNFSALMVVQKIT